MNLPGQKVLAKIKFQKHRETNNIPLKLKDPSKILEKLSDVNHKITLTLEGKNNHIGTLYMKFADRLKPYHEKLNQKLNIKHNSFTDTNYIILNL